MALLPILSVSGVIAASVVSALVYADSTRRGLPSPVRRLRALAFGVPSFGGFLVPYVYADHLHHVYFVLIKQHPHLVSPYELLAVNLATGVLICAGVLVLYVLGSRYVSPGATEETPAP